MATFSENQVRQLYVVNDASKFTVKKDKEGALHFTMPNADGELITSDTIENIMYAKATKSDDMARKTKVVKVEIDPATLVDNKPVPGEDYVVKIEYSQFIAKSDETFYHEFGSAHCKPKESESELLLDLAKNLAKNTKSQGMVKVTLDTATSGEVEIDAYVALTDGDVQAIYVREIPQTTGYVVGVKAVEPVHFTVSTGTVTVGSDELTWGVIEDKTATDGIAIENGYTIADMEYFYHGERGDQYRGMGWPNVIHTKYMADPTKKYDCIDIHYAYVGANHAVQKSEKDITIVCPNDGAHTVINAVAAKINAQAETKIVNVDFEEQQVEKTTLLETL